MSTGGNVAVIIAPPKRGGVHPIYGNYLGGAKLDDEYKCVTKSGGSGVYRFSTQRRHEKTMSGIEKTLRDARDSPTSIKFNGKLEASEGSLSEIGKERFVVLLERRVIEHGQQTFYSIKDSDNKVVDLFENAHRFNLEAVMAEHERRISEYTLTFDQYDTHELDDIELSRMVVSSLLTESFYETICVRFGHLEDFDSYPGSCLFMMALEACNASVSHDVEGAKQKLDAMTLDTYPGEDVTAFATAAQKLVKIMQGDYALPVQTGSNIIKKITKTSSEFFNRKMFSLLDDVKTMEHKYKLSDPRTLTADSKYGILGPLGIIATIQQAHGALLTEHDWPALTSTVPQANAALPSSTGPSAPVSNDVRGRTTNSGIRCFRCQGQHHIRDCTQNADGTPRAPRTALSAWKYVEPSDLTESRTDIRGNVWKFCTKCKCRLTQRVGIYQLSHWDRDHVNNFTGNNRSTSNRGSNSSRTTSNPADETTPPPVTPSANPTPTPSPTPGSSAAPQINNSSVTFNLLPPGPPDISLHPDVALSADDDDDPDTIEFLGVWCLPISAADVADAKIVGRNAPVSECCETNMLERERSTVTNASYVSSSHTELEEIFYDAGLFDAYPDESQSVCVSGDEFWDSVCVSCDEPGVLHAAEVDNVHEVKDSLPTFEYAPTLGWFHHVTTLMWFWITIMSWDSFSFWFEAPKPRSLRRIRRSKFQFSLPRFPAKWLILSYCIMLSPTFYQAINGNAPNFPVPSPSSAMAHVIEQSRLTYDRVKQLDDLVQLNYDTWKQLNLIYFNQLWNAMLSNENNAKVSEQCANTDLDLFFDCYESDPTPNEQLHYFDADLQHEEPGHFDLVRLDDICQPRGMIDCCFPLSENDETNVNLSTCACAHLTQNSGLLTSIFSFGETRHPVIFDTGASLGITYNKEDFDGPITIPKGELRLGGMAQGLLIEGIGPVTYSFRNGDGSEVEIRSNCYYVPKAKVRLISPQRLFNEERGVKGRFEGTEQVFRLSFDNCPILTVEYDERNHLPIGYATIGRQISRAVNPQANILLTTADENQNLTAGQKLLLHWHYRFGHLNFPRVQYVLRNFPFLAQKFTVASKCDIGSLKCEICQYSKNHRKPTQASRSKSNEERLGALKAEHLGPGVRISVDHFESRLLGRTFDSYGKASSAHYKGGCIFVDHGSGYLHVENQLGFSAVETIRAKQNFEKMSLDHGVVIQSYLTDNGAFKAASFVDHIRNSGQRIQYCGTNAHHQNGVAERSIRTISNMTRTLILHAAAHWKDGIDSTLWPMAVAHATHIYNHTPNSNGICPADVFTGSMIPRHRLKDIHVWGCPAYILDPKLQGGAKLPRWQPRSRRGVYMGFSPVHSSEVPLVLNLGTGSITAQFHVVFDDEFSTVHSVERETEPPDFWDDLCLESTVAIPVEGSNAQPLFLADEWLTDAERAAKIQEIDRRDRIRAILAPNSVPSTTTSSTVTSDALRSQPTLVPMIEREPNPSTLPGAAAPITENSTMMDTSTVTDTSVDSGISPNRRSQRANKGTFQSTRYFDEVFLTPLDRVKDCDAYTQQMAYIASLYTCYDTGLENISDPRIYAAKHRTTDPDSPTFHQAMNGPNSEEYIKAMQLEVSTLVQQRTWKAVAREPHMHVLKGTWVFKLKRLPDGTPSKFKARFCARGDLQQSGVDYFDTYAPVVQWSTIRLLLATVLTECWATRQVDYTNAFAQAEINEEVYLEYPKMFGPRSGADRVLRLLKSLYGLRQAPRTFFEKLRDGLLERGYVQSEIDPCLFLKPGIMCVVYVDDTIFAGADTDILENEIKSLGVNDTTQRHKFQLRNEGEVGAFLGIQISKTGTNEFYLSQPGLIDKVLVTSGMSECNGVDTPTGPNPLGSDLDGLPFQEKWEYRTVIGMLMYISANTRPDIAYAVHQAARFSHAPKDSHAIAVKRILRYLKRTHDKGLQLRPNSSHQVDCYVDADFAGNFAVEHPQNPESVKSRTGYIILYQGSPLLWVSKLQTQIALSTMEAEYVALSQSMRDLIPIRELLKEIMRIVFNQTAAIQYRTHSKAFEPVATPLSSNINQSTVYEDNAACLKFAQTGQLSPRTKHIGIPYHWFRSQVRNLDIAIVAVSTSDQLADPFTKGLGTIKFQKFRRILMGW